MFIICSNTQFLWINIINNASSKKLTIYSHIESIYSIATTSFNHSPSYFIINKVGTQHNMLPFVHSELPSCIEVLKSIKILLYSRYTTTS